MKKFFTFQFLVNTYSIALQPKKYESFFTVAVNEQIEAPERCVENILNFARSYRVVDSKSAGKVEILLN